MAWTREIDLRLVRLVRQHSPSTTSDEERAHPIPWKPVHEQGQPWPEGFSARVLAKRWATYQGWLTPEGAELVRSFEFAALERFIEQRTYGGASGQPPLIVANNKRKEVETERVSPTKTPRHAPVPQQELAPQVTSVVRSPRGRYTMNTQENAPQTRPEAPPAAARSFEQRMAEVESNNTRVLTMLETLMTRLVPGASAATGAGPLHSISADGGQDVASQASRGAQDTRVAKPSTPAAAQAPAKVEEDVSDNEVRQMLKSGKALSHLRHDGDYTFHIERKPRLVMNKNGKWYPNFAGESFQRVDMICTASAPGYEPRCSARRYVDRDPATGEVLGSQDIGEHSAHGRRNRPRADPDVLARGKRLLESGVPPAQAEMILAKRARAEGPGPLRANRTMAKRALSQQLGYMHRKENPFAANEVIGNVIARFGLSLIKTNIQPVNFIYMMEWQRVYASTRTGKANVLLLDTTFKLVINNILLTTLLVQAPDQYKKVYFPLAWMVHGGTETAEVYGEFLRTVNLHAGGMRPKVVLRDWSKAIKKAIQGIWPQAKNVGDLWHFYHDNCKWLNEKRVSQIDADLILTELRGIVHESSQFVMQQKLEVWRQKCKAKCPAYVEYFQKEWLTEQEDASVGAVLQRRWPSVK